MANLIYSRPLLRVFKNFKFVVASNLFPFTKKKKILCEGIYLSSQQLIDLGNQLALDGSDGACFMIGKDTDDNNKPINSVEVIPYTKTKKGLKFYEKDSLIGNLNVQLSDGLQITSMDNKSGGLKLLGGGGSGSQRTPPPTPE